MTVHTSASAEFTYVVDRFADLQVLRYQVPGFEALPLPTKALLYHLSQAALAGRDITWDQNYRHNLRIRRTLEAVLAHPPQADPDHWSAFLLYLKRVWFSNGIHHHYSNLKFVPSFPFSVFADWVRACPVGALPLLEGEDVETFLAWLEPVIMDPNLDAKRVNKDADADLLQTSCVNFYSGVTQAEAEAYYAAKTDKNDPTPPSYGLNSRLVKTADGQLVEQVWKIDGLYGPAIAQIVAQLEQALPYAETPQQAESIQLLIAYYRTGDLRTFDAYNKAWLADTEASVDQINGFIETYSDPLDFRGTFEAIVSVKDPVATGRMQIIAGNALWFEAHSPTDPAFKREDVVGVSGSVINVVQTAGDASPTSPIGVNLPNADWIRAQYGSKSVNLANIVAAYNQIKSSMLDEFVNNAELIARNKQYGDIADHLHTDLHEVIGHGSGKILPGVGTPKETLRNYSSTLEEARADLVALYYVMDPQLIELGLMPSLEVGRVAYDDFMLNGLLWQLRRLSPGEQLEEDHMRNRALIARWTLAHGEGAVAMVQRNGKTYVEIRDYDRLRELFGKLLAEVQRIKSEGDFEAGKALVEGYGVKVDPELHAEVLQRFQSLNMAAYNGFLSPILEAVRDTAGNLCDVTISYEGDFEARMRYYAAHHSFLPHVN